MIGHSLRPALRQATSLREGGKAFYINLLSYCLAAVVLENGTLFQHHFTAQKHVFDALGREIGLGEGRAVPDGFVVEDGDVRVGTHVQPALGGKAQPVGGGGGDHFHRVIEPDFALAGEFRQEPGEGTGGPGVPLAVVHQAVTAHHDGGVAIGQADVLFLG